MTTEAPKELFVNVFTCDSAWLARESELEATRRGQYADITAVRYIRADLVPGARLPEGYEMKRRLKAFGWGVSLVHTDRPRWSLFAKYQHGEWMVNQVTGDVDTATVARVTHQWMADAIVHASTKRGRI